jgi:hypothetical protein
MQRLERMFTSHVWILIDAWRHHSLPLLLLILLSPNIRKYVKEGREK